MGKRRGVSLLAALVLAVGIGGALASPAQSAPKPVAPDGSALVTSKVKTKPHGKVIKGMPSVSNGFKTASLTDCTVSACYRYAGAKDTNPGPAYTGTGTGTRGAQVTLDVKRPGKLIYDHHTLAEIAVQDGAHGHAVEAGWTVSKYAEGGNGDGHPHFWVFNWINGVPNPESYNSDDFVLSANPPLTPGQDINTLVDQKITLSWEYYDANNGCDPGIGCVVGMYLKAGIGANTPTFVGVFPATLWTSGGYSFTGPDLVQVFAEGAFPWLPSQTDLMTGTLAGSAQGAELSGYALLGVGAPTAVLDSVITGTNCCNTDRWNEVLTSNTSVRLGGPGGNDNYTGANGTTDNLSGVGTGTLPSGWGAFGTYNNTSGGLATGKVSQIDGSASQSVCRANMGTADGQFTTGIRTVVNTGYLKVRWFAFANDCTGGYVDYDYGKTNLASSITLPAHASFKILGTKVACAANWPAQPQTCSLS